VDIGERWGVSWPLTLAREIKAGTFVSLDGEPCLRAVVNPLVTYTQEVML
jgi:hypothetical protein